MSEQREEDSALADPGDVRVDENEAEGTGDIVSAHKAGEGSLNKHVFFLFMPLCEIATL